MILGLVWTHHQATVAITYRPTRTEFLPCMLRSSKEAIGIYEWCCFDGTWTLCREEELLRVGGHLVLFQHHYSILTA